MAHGLSKLINFHEETQQFVEEFEHPDNLDTDGKPIEGNILDHKFINSFDQDDIQESGGLK